MSVNSEKIDIDRHSSSIQTHLTILQNVIQRMASNSSANKAWCVTLVSAILVIIADKGKPEYAYIAMLPTFVFAALDAYYLALEKGFRQSYNEFISKLHNGTLTEVDLYAVVPEANRFSLLLESVGSFSVWGFYISLILLIVISKVVVLG